VKPREKWRAAFKLLLPSPPEQSTGALCFRVFIKTPYPGTRTAWFQDDFVMHPFS
jgi:hypothetical protein